MRALSVLVLGVAMTMCAGTARAQDDSAKKIVGLWEFTKSDSMIPAGSTLEFTKDFKLTFVVKDGAKEEKYEGTYKIDKDKLTVKLNLEGEKEETVTVKKLTDDALEVVDKDKKVDILKKKK